MRKHQYTTGREMRLMRRLTEERLHPCVPIWVIPGGKRLERKTAGAVGFDAFIRAIVSPTEKDPENHVFRRTLFDFENMPTAGRTELQVNPVPREGGLQNGTELAYDMEPGESVLVGIGFVTAMPFPIFYWVAPRSGLASVHKVTVANAPGTVDPDYRGEAGVVVLNGSPHRFRLRHGMRIAQIVFQEALIPAFVPVAHHAELGATIRGTGGFGSTGLM